MQEKLCSNHHYSDCGWVFEKSPRQDLEIYLQSKIIDLLHEFNRQCLLETYDGYPIKRKNRKEFFANQILHHIRSYLKD